MSPSVKCQCCQILIEEEQTNKDKEKRKKTLKHPSAFMFYNTKTKSYISYPWQTTLLTP